MKREHALILIPLCILQFFSGIGGVDIYFQDEAEAAGCAIEMLRTGEMLVPTFNCTMLPNKPPLHYFFMMLGYQIFGIGPVGARFFSGLFGMLTVIGVYFAASSRAKGSSGLYAATTLGLMLYFPIQMKQAIPDPYFIFLLTISILGIFHGSKRNNTLVCYLGYAALGLATLTEGPAAVAITIAAFLTYLIITRRLQWPHIKRLLPFSGLMVTTAVALPWYIAVHRLTDGAFTEGFWTAQYFGRYYSAIEGHGLILIMTLAFVLIGMLPATVYLFQSLQHSWQGRKHEDLAAIAFSSFLSVIILFSLFSRNVPILTAACYPFAAIMIGVWLNQTLKKQSTERRRFLIPAIIVFLISIGLVLVAKYGTQEFFNMPDVGYRVWFLVPGVFAAALGIIAAFKRREERCLIYQGTFSLWTSLVIAYIFFPAINEINPLRSAQSLEIKTEGIASYGETNQAWVYQYGCVDEFDDGTYDALMQGVRSGEYKGILTDIGRARMIMGTEELRLEWQHRDLFRLDTVVILRPAK